MDCIVHDAAWVNAGEMNMRGKLRPDQGRVCAALISSCNKGRYQYGQIHTPRAGGKRGNFRSPMMSKSPTTPGGNHIGHIDLHLLGGAVDVIVLCLPP